MDSTTDRDQLLVRLDRSARSVSRLSTATKGISIVMLVIASFVLLYGISRVGHDDFIGFSLVALVVAGLAIVFWSTAAFHAAFGESLALVASAHTSLELLLRAQQHAAQPATARAKPRVRANETAATAPEPVGPEPSAARDEPAAGPGIAAAAPVEPAAPPTSRACPHCGAEIRLDVSRCRYCMESV